MAMVHPPKKVIRVVSAIQLSYYVLPTINPKPSRSAGMPRSTTAGMAARVQQFHRAGQRTPLQSPRPRVRLRLFPLKKPRRLRRQRLEYVPISDPFMEQIPLGVRWIRRHLAKLHVGQQEFHQDCFYRPSNPQNL